MNEEVRDSKAVKDKCVSCERDTLYDQHHHVDFRIGYVEGAGQLCLDCYDKIYVLERPECNDWRFDTMESKDQTLKKDV